MTPSENTPRSRVVGVRRGLVLCLLILVALSAPALAQDYSFSVPEMMLHVYVNPDASVTIEYEIDFECSPGAHAIDVVDVGLPHGGYDTGNMTAAVDGQTISSFDPGDYQGTGTGVAVPLGSHAIQAGGRGHFSFRCAMPDLVYQDTTDKEYASLRITPTWFDADLLQGTTQLVTIVYLPNEIKPEELKYQDERNRYSKKLSLDNYTAAVWEMPGVRVDGPHMVGLSFPKRGMDRVVTMTFFKLLMKWWTESTGLRTFLGIVFFILFGIVFFRASQGTGWSCFLGLLVLLFFVFVNSPLIQLFAIPALPLVWYLSEKSLKKRRGKYLPAIASVEGGGVKRGLAAPEAAVLLELPLGRVLTLTLFGLLKKGIIEQIEAEPLSVKVAPDYLAETKSERRKAASKNGKVIHGYEQPFIDAIIAGGALPVSRVDFNSAMKEMIKRTAKRLEGFDLERTQSYYRHIVSRAWHDAKAIGEVEERTTYTDDNLLWLLAADDYHDNFGMWHTRGYYYHAPWSRSAGIPLAEAASSTPVGGRTSLGDVAGSFAGWTENVSGGLANHMDPVSVGLSKEGILNLSGADKVTMDVLEGMSEGGGGGGGGGCACAGCACACACAGGGR